MLDADLVVDPDNGAFREAPDVLNGVGVNVSPDPLFVAVIDRLVNGVVVFNALVRCPFVGEVGDRLIGCDLPDELVKRLSVAGLK